MDDEKKEKARERQGDSRQRPAAPGALVRLVQRLLEINGHRYGSKKSF